MKKARLRAATEESPTSGKHFYYSFLLLHIFARESKNEKSNQEELQEPREKQERASAHICARYVNVTMYLLLDQSVMHVLLVCVLQKEPNKGGVSISLHKAPQQCRRTSIGNVRVAAT